jgi:predicted TIM-barrel fold metal-dependent hydrolase
MPVKIVDAQVHIWSQTVVPTSGLHRKVEKFTAEELLAEMDVAGVDAALIHPPSGWDPNANALAIEAARKYPDRFAVMGQFPLQDPKNRKLIHGWRKQPGMMGLRWPLLLEEHQKWLYDGSLDWLWPAAEAEGLPPHYSTLGYPFKNIQDGLHRIFDAFGPKRFFWGTDVTRMSCSYRQCVTFFTEELPWLKARDLEDVMGRALCAWIGWSYRFD